MPETIDITPEFEQLLQSMLAVPEPDPAFIDLQRSQFLSRASLPLKETKMKSRTLRFSPRLAWGLALLALLALIVAAFSTPTLVNALRRLLGYVPGVGVVEQTTTLRVLAAPVIITRAGVALTIEQAVAQPDKTVIVYRYVLDTASLDRPAPADAGSLPSFMADPALRLPDGTELKILAGLHEPETLSDAERAAGKSAVRYRMEFKPLPATVDHVTLLLPRLVPIAPGAGPEFWEIPLDFKPSTGAGLPVIEVAATDTQQPAPTALVTTPTPQVDQDVAFVLDNVVPARACDRNVVRRASRIGDGYRCRRAGYSVVRLCHASTRRSARATKLGRPGARQGLSLAADDHIDCLVGRYQPGRE